MQEAAAGATASPDERADEHVDVLVVGAGLAGLTAAWRLRQQGVSRLRIVEARERVGGRTLTEVWCDGLPLDLGAQWIGPDQTRITALAAELGLATFPTPSSGRHVMVLDGQRHVYRGLFPLRRTRVGLDFVRAAAQLEWAARQVPAGDPWSARGAAALDARTLGEWLDGRLRTPQARALFDILSGLTLGGDPADLSLLWVLQHLRSAGGLSPLITVQGGAQDRRFLEGAQAVCQRLAHHLSPWLMLGAPVRRVVWQGDAGARVLCGERWIAARRVIVAMSPNDRQRLCFEPALPAPIEALQARMSLFKGIKVQAVYERPFWRDAGLSGQSLNDRGIAPLSFDNSHPHRPEGVLVTFVVGKSGPGPLMPSEAQLADPAMRRTGVLASLCEAFGPAAAHPLAVVEQDWREEAWSSGCIPAMAPGVLTATGAAAQADVGPLIWAGTEMAHRWGGYMDGAVRSGERAAQACLH
jgi:monoamine oxidase